MKSTRNISYINLLVISMYKVFILSVRTVLHYPRLDTVMMVEDTIKNSKEEITKTGLWYSLPKKVQYQTLQVILDYLEKSNKILFMNKKIVWIATNAKIDKIIKHGNEY